MRSRPLAAGTLFLGLAIGFVACDRPAEPDAASADVRALFDRAEALRARIDAEGLNAAREAEIESLVQDIERWNRANAGEDIVVRQGTRPELAAEAGVPVPTAIVPLAPGGTSWSTSCHCDSTTTILGQTCFLVRKECQFGSTLCVYWCIDWPTMLPF